MDEKLKYTLLRDPSDDVSIWTRLVSKKIKKSVYSQTFLNLLMNFLFIQRHEKRMWFFTLLMGTCMLYSTRTTMPLLLPAVASELRWSKTESGTVLSSFFWGYTVTQVFQFSCFHLKFINSMRI